jgi:hypothetical protein
MLVSPDIKVGRQRLGGSVLVTEGAFTMLVRNVWNLMSFHTLKGVSAQRWRRTWASVEAPCFGFWEYRSRSSFSWRCSGTTDDSLKLKLKLRQQNQKQQE